MPSSSDISAFPFSAELAAEDAAIAVAAAAEAVLAEPQATPQTALRLKGRPLVTSRDVATYFEVPHAKMLWTLYQAPDDAKYRAFEIPKRTGGMRPIHAPYGLVRDLQDKFKIDLVQLYKPHPGAHGFISERSVVSNAAAHAGKRWVFNIDLEDFFPTINFGRIRGLLLQPPFGMGPAAAAVCAQIVTFKNGLPQGAPTSPVLSNLIAISLDRGLRRLARNHRLSYSRYADDITFSTDNPQFPAAIALQEPKTGGGSTAFAGAALERTVTASGFRINARKVRLQGRGVRQAVTGLSVNRLVNVQRRPIRRIRAMLHAWKKFGLAAAGDEHFAKYRRRLMPRGEGDLGTAFRNIVYGELAFVKMVRGAADPVFLNLCAKVLDLDPNPSKFLRQMVFGADDFEVFISHATEDKADIARPIFAACGRLRLKAFLDEAHIGWGENFTKKINTALGAARTVLVIVSANSVSKDWPVAEINTALTFEAEGKKRVLAVMVGNPDLSKLPLLKTKNYLIWDGNPEKVAKALEKMLRPQPPAPAPAVRQQAPPKAPSPVPAAVRPASWLSRLFRRRKS